MSTPINNRYDFVLLFDVENGNRFETYTIDGEPGSGMICLNGAAARQVQVASFSASVGQRRIICAPDKGHPASRGGAEDRPRA